MQYTYHFSKIIQAYGVPNFSVKGLRTIMNIIHLEGKNDELHLLIKDNRKPHTNGHYTYLVNNNLRRIKELSGGKSPQELLKSLCGA
jgi:hypothetical protein